MADWLIARPIAHRGLHDVAANIVENTASAINAALAAGYGIEIDLQVTADGEAVVYHDDALGRLTDGSGALDQFTAAELKRVSFENTTDRMLTLSELCDLVAGRTTLLLELKSRFNGDERLPRRVATIISRYQGPLAAMSFDPAQVQMLRNVAPALRRGLVAQRRRRRADPDQGVGLTSLLGSLLGGLPQFLAYSVKDLPATAPLLAKLAGIPVLTWTVRNEEDRRRSAYWADQIIFEGFRP